MTKEVYFFLSAEFNRGDCNEAEYRKRLRKAGANKDLIKKLIRMENEFFTGDAADYIVDADKKIVDVQY
ncbi:hypothetical protein [Zoogloea sp.]|uniref:hypothetical protein n=1 Tax=Zoogloea sp. TaxID=49181 RepID=UPI0014156128|nr:MAG: hypothetical protein F9K15_12810 [Zoogloea sp.]